MAIRNCVGARYVPKFADPVEWQANTSYEAMVIVTYNNASYTSKVPVPPTVGNPAENSTYWALTGNYNAQVEQYRQEIGNYNAQVEQYRQETGNYNAQVEQYRQETGNYNAQVEEYRQETADIKTKVNTNISDISVLKTKDTELNDKINSNTNDINKLKTNYTTVKTELSSHITNKSNPHNVTKDQIGLGSVDNVSKSDILLSVYPVGSIYMSTNSMSPAELFGGTWEQLKDTFLLAAGDTYTAGSTGGEAQHTLTIAEMPSHDHAAGNNIQFVTSGSPAEWNIATGSQNYHAVANTTSTGGSQPHNNMPPYLAVYAWKRVE